MDFYFNAEHPKDVLLFYIATQPRPGDEERVGTLLDAMAVERDWIIEPPRFVHQTEEVVDPRTGEPVATLGGFHEIYSAHPPWRDVLPSTIDARHHDECVLIVSRLADLSRTDGFVFHFEFNGEMVGAIEGGRPDERLADQFLGSWKRGLRRET